ncbi:DciA family protein [Streptomyces albidoflavus]
MTAPDQPPTGVDLARVALRAARETARRQGADTRRTAPAKPTIRRTSGREPVSLAGALDALITDRAWELPAAGGTLRDRWAAIAPQLAEHVAATGYNPKTGALTLCPDSAAWRTRTVHEQANIIAAMNKSAGRTVVRAVRILAPRPLPAPAPPDPQTSTTRTAPPGPVRTRQSAPLGYHQALDANRRAPRPTTTDPEIQAALDRQTRCAAREPEHLFQPAQEAQRLQETSASNARAAEISRAKALRRRAQERAEQGSHRGPCTARPREAKAERTRTKPLVA